MTALVQDRRTLIHVTVLFRGGVSYSPVISDPLFYLLAISVTLLGLSKDGFAGVGMISTPLLALVVPPLQGAAILLPILICQDAISVWTYRGGSLSIGSMGQPRCEWPMSLRSTLTAYVPPNQQPEQENNLGFVFGDQQDV